MAKQTIEIEDTLSDRINSAKDDLKTEWENFRKENPDMRPDQWEPYDQIHEIADGSTPVYTKEIRDLTYLYGAEFAEAYNNAGIGDGTEDNRDAIAIYYYIEEALWEYARALQAEAEDQ